MSKIVHLTPITFDYNMNIIQVNNTIYHIKDKKFKIFSTYDKIINYFNKDVIVLNSKNKYDIYDYNNNLLYSHKYPIIDIQYIDNNLYILDSLNNITSYNLLNKKKYTYIHETIHQNDLYKLIIHKESIYIYHNNTLEIFDLNLKLIKKIDIEMDFMFIYNNELYINNKYSWNFHTNQTFPLSILYKDKLYYKKGCYLYDKEEIVLYQPGTLSIYNNYLVFKKEDSLFIYKDFKLIKNYTLNKNEKLIDIIDNQLVIKTDWTISLENLV